MGPLVGSGVGVLGLGDGEVGGIGDREVGGGLGVTGSGDGVTGLGLGLATVDLVDINLS